MLRAALEAEFAMPLHVGSHGEEAAVGAALCAAVADGAFGSIAEASAAFASAPADVKRQMRCFWSCCVLDPSPDPSPMYRPGTW